MSFSKFFIDRPIFAGVLSVLIFVAGLLALRAMPISEYPEVAPPQVIVRAQYPGAKPKVIAATVATPIEEQINGVEDMLYMSSPATTDGVLTITFTFKLGADPDKATQLVQNRVSQAEPRLPRPVCTVYPLLPAQGRAHLGQSNGGGTPLARLDAKRRRCLRRCRCFRRESNARPIGRGQRLTLMRAFSTLVDSVRLPLRICFRNPREGGDPVFQTFQPFTGSPPSRGFQWLGYPLIPIERNTR